MPPTTREYPHLFVHDPAAFMHRRHHRRVPDRGCFRVVSRSDRHSRALSGWNLVTLLAGSGRRPDRDGMAGAPRGCKQPGKELTMPEMSAADLKIIVGPLGWLLFRWCTP